MAPLHAPLNLLIVEDNDDLRDSLADALGTRGHHVVALDCAEAVPEQAELTRLDLAIVDLNLPGEDGLALAQRLREAQPGLGIIMLTARAQSSDKVARLRAWRRHLPDQAGVAAGTGGRSAGARPAAQARRPRRRA